MMEIKNFQGLPEEIESSVNKFLLTLTKESKKILEVNTKPSTYPYVLATVLYE